MNAASYFCLALFILSLVSATADHPILVHTNSNEPQLVMRPVNLSGMPSKVISAMAENEIVSSDIHWTMFNSGDEVTEIELQAFLFDSKGELIEAPKTWLRETIASGSTRSFTSQINATLDPEGQAFVAITRSISRGGIWYVEPSKLQLAIRAKLNEDPDLDIPVKYELHAKLGRQDKSEIFKLAVQRILNDDKTSDRIDGQGRVFVLSEGIDFPLAHLREASLIAVDDREIQRLAVKNKRVVYLTCDDWMVEGAQVIANISVRDRVASDPPGVGIPYRFRYSLTSH